FRPASAGMYESIAAPPLKAGTAQDRVAQVRQEGNRGGGAAGDTPKYRGLMTPRRFLAITQTGQSIKLVPMGTLPQSNQHLWVLDHADGSDGACFQRSLCRLS